MLVYIDWFILKISATDMESLIDVVITTPDGAMRSIQVSRDLTRPPPASEPIDTQPFSHGFTGKHDSGQLPAAGQNVYSHVLDAVTEAKATTDQFIVSSLLPEKPAQPQAKKARLEEPVDDSAFGDDEEEGAGLEQEEQG